MINGGRIFAKQLKKEGVEQIFTLCGGQIMPIIYGCRAEGIKVIDVRHENAAVYAADAYARTTGKPGVVLTTLAPGIMHTMQGVFEARGANSPIVVIAAATGIADFDSGAEQDMGGSGTYSLLAPNTAWSARIFDVKRIPEYISKAFRHALNAIPGPVYLEYPENIIKIKVEESEVTFPEFTRTKAQAFGDPGLINQAAQLLKNAEKPVMIVGDTSIFTREYGTAVKELADYLQIPVYATTMARGLFGDEDNLLFRIGEGALSEADVVLALSVNMNYAVNFGKPPLVNKDTKFIQVNPDLTRIGFNAPAHVGIVAGAGAGAKQILEAVKEITPKRTDNEWVVRAAKLHAEYRADWDEGYRYKDITPMHPARLAVEVAKFLESEGRDWSVVADGGDAFEWILRAVKAHRPGQIVGYGMNGTIGTGQGFAIGAWCAHGKPVLEFTGDGSVGFYPMEFETMERHGMQVICIVANNSQWGMVRMAQTFKNPDEIKLGYIASTLPEMRRYDELSKVWNGYGELVTDIHEVIPAIKRAYASGKPAIINVQVDGEHPCPYTVMYGCGGTHLNE